MSDCDATFVEDDSIVTKENETMPFVGLDAGKQRVNILDYPDPKGAFKSGSISCPICDLSFIIKHGSVLIQHFAHAARSDCINRGETIQHLIGKLAVRNHLKKRYPGDVVDLEVPIRGRKRIVDVMHARGSDQRIAHEIQLASITPGEIETRTRDYEDEGIEAVWWLGRAASTESNREYLLTRTGICHDLNFQTNVVSGRLDTFSWSPGDHERVEAGADQGAGVDSNMR